MKLRYTPKTIEDLRGIWNYIAEKLGNKDAADRVSTDILKKCSLLKSQPYMGSNLADRINRSTACRFIVTGKYLVFYRVEKEVISVIRILDTRTDYIGVLLDDLGE